MLSIDPIRQARLSRKRSLRTRQASRSQVQLPMQQRQVFSSFRVAGLSCGAWRYAVAESASAGSSGPQSGREGVATERTGCPPASSTLHTLRTPGVESCAGPNAGQHCRVALCTEPGVSHLKRSKRDFETIPSETRLCSELATQTQQ